ncbi:MAG TPA: glutamine amidotransferase [Rhodocyclaceae bacterium]|mgnify:CR=1 FL=1|nr:glutamine amidotransferase [Rhodocyclaceae bacterium]
MKTAIAIRHVGFEDLGTLEPLLDARGYVVRYVDAAVDDLRALDVVSADLVVVLGGPIGAFDDALYPFIADELALVRRRLESRGALLGICLGAQLIARALGAQVGSMGVKEIGYAPLTLTADGEASPLAALDGVPVLHWHGDQFDIPAAAVRLAGTEVCPNQAFALGRHVLALQCHLEADAHRIERWLVGHACELAQAGLDPRELRTQAHALQARLPVAARAVFARWLDAVEPDGQDHHAGLAARVPDQGDEPTPAPSGTLTRHDRHGQYLETATVEDFRCNLAAVRARIDAACLRAGRDPAEVRLLPVSKTKPEASLRMAHAAGCRMFGENKVQEAHHKWGALQDLTDLQWSVIGHLQTNKAKLVARFAAEFQALDSLRVAEALDRRLQVEGRSLDVFVQVNTSGEASKYGLNPEDVPAFIQALPAFSALRVRGLMTLALFSSEAERVRQCFGLLRTLRDRLRQNAPAAIGLDELSMGMSGDFEIAIEEGATVVRVGQAIFGARPLPDSHYWPGETGTGA